MVTRWSQKSPGLKILWIWTLGTAASNHFGHTCLSSCFAAYLIVQVDASVRWLFADLLAVVVGGVVRMRINDAQKILREEEEAAAAAATTPASSERIFKDDE